MASGMEIFKLWGTIEINKNKAVADIKAVDATAQKSSKNIQGNFGNIAKSFLKVSAIITGAAAAVGTALFALAVKTSNVADEIDKMSIRTGISRERLQELKYVSSQVGVEFSSLQTAMNYLTRSMYGAEAGSQRQAEAFKKLGINTKDATGNLRNATEVFDEVLYRLASMSNETERNGLALEIFGRGANELTPLLAAGTQGIAELSAKARELGLVMGDDAVAANVKFKDTLDTLKRSVGALFMNLS
ncbi:MAG TPA: phage tail tape measure protein, partial [Mesotoga infera]|nr:phage tail tape measure protein [Mesotoga infera]